jgi:putative transposase
MRRKRVRVEGAACYHCMSRVVAGERLLKEREREVMRGMLWRVAEFCGVRILSYAVMSNHFHVLVSVPCREPVGDAELVRRYGVLYAGSLAPWQPSAEVLAGILAAGGEEAEGWRRRLTARMGDVSAFMKTVKQRFTGWYNKTHGRFGTLWADRFKSVLVEGSDRALKTVAAYIDLNPVRAGLVDDPAAYRWCGYAEAMAGRRRAREGLTALFAGSLEGWGDVLAGYRQLLFGVGAAGASGVGKIARGRVLAVLQAGGEVSVAEALRCRVRYFSDGAVLGSSAFVEEWADSGGRPSAHEQGGDPGRARREPHARPLRGAPWPGLAVLRGLRKAIFT